MMVIAGHQYCDSARPDKFKWPYPLILFSWEPTLYLVTAIKRPNEIELYLEWVWGCLMSLPALHIVTFLE